VSSQREYQYTEMNQSIAQAYKLSSLTAMAAMRLKLVAHE
jgi:hypothetical protein